MNKGLQPNSILLCSCTCIHYANNNNRLQSGASISIINQYTECCMLQRKQTEGNDDKKEPAEELSQNVRNFVQCVKRKHSGGLGCVPQGGYIL